jgi:uncharacterized protein YbaA (DUF1428 family)
MTYIDGFVIPVPVGKKDAYREMAAKAAPVFQEFGALEVVETWGDDVPQARSPISTARSAPRRARMSSSPGSSGRPRRPATKATRR